MSEIIFEVQEDEVDGGYVATALGHAIVSQGDTLEELREMVKDAVRCHFGDGVPGPMPRNIHTNFEKLGLQELQSREVVSICQAPSQKTQED